MEVSSMAEKKYQYVRKTFTFDGRRYEAYGKTEEEAIEKKIEMKKRLEEGAAAESKSATVDQWYARWKALYKDEQGITEKSLKMYDEKYNKYIKPAIGKKKIASVTEMHLQAIMNETADMSKSTALKVRMVITQIFHKAYRTRLIPFDPSEDLQIAKSTTEGKRRSLTERERELFLEVAPNIPCSEILLAMYYTGMRPGELRALTWDDVDFEEHEISVDKAIESGTKDKVKSTKTDAGVRIIPMRPQLEEILLGMEKSPDDNLVFHKQKGGRHTEFSLRRMWTRLLREMDIANGATLYRNHVVESTLADDLVPYCLRHTFCTDLEDAEVPINVAKTLMGHSSIQVTANTYTHSSKSTLHKNIQLLEADSDDEE